MYSPFKAPKDPSYAAIAAAARLGHKYQMTSLLEQAVDYLKTYYTNDYVSWITRGLFVAPNFSDVHSIGVLNLVRLLGETSLLPTAVLACCQLNLRLVRGFARADGTREQLTPDDLALCVTAKTRLVQESVRVALLTIQPRLSKACKTAAQCERGFGKLVRKAADRVREIATADPFVCPLVRLECHLGGDLCHSCWLSAQNRGVMERREVWTRLPKILGLEDPGPGGVGADGAAVAGAT